MTLTLVEHRDTPKVKGLGDDLFILVGNPKTGKTTLAASFPDSYVLELEPKGGDRVAGRIHEIPDLETFRDVLEVVFETPEIKTVVIDTIDVLSDWIEDEVAGQFGLKQISERKKEVSGFEVWGEFKKRMEGLVGYFKDSGKLVIVLAHTKEPKVVDDQVITPAGINIPGKGGSYLAAQADLIGFTYRQAISTGTQYFVTFKGGPLGTWGSRIAELNDKTLKLDQINPYRAFQDIFSETSKPATARPKGLVAKTNGTKKPAKKTAARKK